MRFTLLGSTDVRVDGERLPLGGPKQRLLLVHLLLRANQVVPADRLIEEIWGERSPPAARSVLQAYVSRLRKVLGPTRIDGRGQGYMLHATVDEVDALLFEGLIRQARDRSDADPEGALALLDQALALWNGPPLADLSDQPSLQGEVARLEALHLQAVEDRIDAALALGRPVDTAELQRLVERHPLRERLWGQLMLGLYRAGRQAEALGAFRRARDLLSEELGIDPSPELQRLHEQILRQHPELEPEGEPSRRRPREPTEGEPVAIAAPSDPAPAPVRRAPRLPRWLASSRPRLAVTIIVVSLVAAGIPVALSRLGREPPSVRIGDHAVGMLDPESGRVTGSIDIRALPGAIAFGEGAVWVADTEGWVSRLDPQERRVTETIEVGQDLAGIAVGEGAVWVTSARDGTVSRINPATNTVVQSIDVGNGPTGIAVGGGVVWVANRHDNTVVRIDPGTNDVTGEAIPVTGSPTGISFGHGAAWVTSGTEALVSRIDPQNGAVVEPIGVGNGPGNVVAGEGGVWVANRLDGTASRIDPGTNTVAATVPTGEGASGIAVGADGVWVASELGGRVTRFEPDGTRVASHDLGVAVVDVALVDESLWFSARGAPTSHRGGTLTLVSALDVESLDPATDPGLPYDIASLVGDGLVGFKRVGGVDGTTLVPNLAVSIPRPTDGGTTYTFRLRPGIRYSTGEPVRASDVRGAIERAFRVGSSFRFDFHSLVGVDACVESPASCDLAEGIHADDEQGTVTFRLTAPVPDFLYGLAFPAAYPVPPGTSDDIGVTPIPGTGPYLIARYVPGEVLELERNPRFEQWTGHRPDGFVDRIVLRLNVPAEELADELLEGRADYIVNPPLIPPDEMERLMTEFTHQTHVYRRPGVWHFFLNTGLPPFDDVRVRRAVNFAVDRERVLDLYPFPGSDMTCQVLPPGFTGYLPYCPYTVDPSPSGTWVGPDMARARDLVAASGTAGIEVTVWEFPAFEEVARYFASVLEDLGYRARVRVIQDPNEFFTSAFDSRNEMQAGGMSWLTPTPSPQALLALLTCEAFVPGDPERNVNAAQFCDPQVDRAIERARQVHASDPAAAGPLWAQIDRAIVDQAPWVPLITPGWIDVVSDRLGNYQASPVWGLLLDQVWVT